MSWKCTGKERRPIQLRTNTCFAYCSFSTGILWMIPLQSFLIQSLFHPLTPNSLLKSHSVEYESQNPWAFWLWAPVAKVETLSLRDKVNASKQCRYGGAEQQGHCAGWVTWGQESWTMILPKSLSQTLPWIWWRTPSGTTGPHSGNGHAIQDGRGSERQSD